MSAQLYLIVRVFKGIFLELKTSMSFKNEEGFVGQTEKIWFPSNSFVFLRKKLFDGKEFS